MDSVSGHLKARLPGERGSPEGGHSIANHLEQPKPRRGVAALIIILLIFALVSA
jgi:hypothetical protein